MKFFLTSDIDKSARLSESSACNAQAQQSPRDSMHKRFTHVESNRLRRQGGNERKRGGKEIRSHLRICRKAASTLTFREPTSWRLFLSLLCHCCPCLPPSASSSSLFVLCATLDLHRFRRPTSRIRNLFTACGRDDHQQLIIAHRTYNRSNFVP